MKLRINGIPMGEVKDLTIERYCGFYKIKNPDKAYVLKEFVYREILHTDFDKDSLANDIKALGEIAMYHRFATNAEYIEFKLHCKIEEKLHRCINCELGRYDLKTGYCSLEDCNLYAENCGCYLADKKDPEVLYDNVITDKKITVYAGGNVYKLDEETIEYYEEKCQNPFMPEELVIALNEVNAAPDKALMIYTDRVTQMLDNVAELLDKGCVCETDRILTPDGFK